MRVIDTSHYRIIQVLYCSKYTSFESLVQVGLSKNALTPLNPQVYCTYYNVIKSVFNF